MVIGRVSGSMETLAADVNPHKKAVDLAEQNSRWMSWQMILFGIPMKQP